MFSPFLFSLQPLPRLLLSLLSPVLLHHWHRGSFQSAILPESLLGIFRAVWVVVWLWEVTNYVCFRTSCIKVLTLCLDNWMSLVPPAYLSNLTKWRWQCYLLLRILVGSFCLTLCQLTIESCIHNSSAQVRSSGIACCYHLAYMSEMFTIPLYALWFCSSCSAEREDEAVACGDSSPPVQFPDNHVSGQRCERTHRKLLGCWSHQHRRETGECHAFTANGPDRFSWEIVAGLSIPGVGRLEYSLKSRL